MICEAFLLRTQMLPGFPYARYSSDAGSRVCAESVLGRNFMSCAIPPSPLNGPQRRGWLTDKELI